MSYATVPSYHVFMAAKAAMHEITKAMDQRAKWIAQTSQRRWFFKNRPDRSIRAINEMEVARGNDVGRVMNLAVAALSVDPTAMVAIDEYDFELIREQFFDAGLTTQVRQHLAFAAMPGGHA